MCEVKTAAAELLNYAGLFDGKLGSLPVKYKRTVDLNVQPVVRSAHKLPVAMRDRVNQELDSMEEQGVISKITEPTDWCSNNVSVPNRKTKMKYACVLTRET